MAATLNNLGILLKNSNEFAGARQGYEEALEIRRKLAAANPQTYLPDVAMTLNNLGILLSDSNEFAGARQAYEEALETYRSLAVANPRTYLPDVAMTSINLSLFFLESEPDKETSLVLVKEAIVCLLPFLETVPVTKNYFQVALQIVQSWGLEPEAFIQEVKAELNKKET